TSGEKANTPEMVRAQMIGLHAAWLRRAGAELSEGVAVEISPLYALDAEELSGKIPPKTRITEDTYFC
ncbi:MAG: UDPGP type 1 family protein, partial [Pirellulales bacterium]|nr:UDPGP type 1 family protein [Pirellulales bacterium]